MIKTFIVSVSLLLSLSLSSLAVSADSQIANKADEVRPLLVSQQIPDLNLLDINGKAFSLRKTVAEKPALLIFYRGGWCPYCNVHLAELRKIEQQLVKNGFQIIAISPDEPSALRETLEKNKLGYTLASDKDLKVTKAFGLAFKTRRGGVLPVPAAILVKQKRRNLL